MMSGMSQGSSSDKAGVRKEPPAWVPKAIGVGVVLCVLLLGSWWIYSTFIRGNIGGDIVVGTKDPPKGLNGARGMFNPRASQRRMQDDARSRI